MVTNIFKLRFLSSSMRKTNRQFQIIQSNTTQIPQSFTLTDLIWRLDMRIFKCKQQY
jgi:hypothetical protein